MPAAAIPAAVAETLKPRGNPGAAETAELDDVVMGAGRLKMWSMP
jgi:hypothetical protein